MTATDLQRSERSSPGQHTGTEAGSAWWIENDGLLRDEGVVFGLSSLPRLPDSKVEAIEAYFRARIARADAIRQLLREERERLERQAKELRQKLESRSADLWGPAMENQAETSAFEVPPDGSDAQAVVARPVESDQPGADRHRLGGKLHTEAPTGGLLRYFLGSILALAICMLAYFVVREVLGDRFEHPEFVAVGVMLAGMFVVFAPTSLLFSRDREHREPPWGTELWKVRLAEIGLPIVAAAFVVAWGERRDPVRDTVAFLFLSMLFLLGGRLLLSLLTRLGSEFEQAADRRRRRRREKLRRRELERLRTDANALDQQIAAINEQIRQLQTSDELRAECEHKVAVLQSEYELARAAMEHTARGELNAIHAGLVGVQ